VRCRMRLLSRNDAPGTHAKGWLACRVGWRAFYTKSRGQLSLTRRLQLSPGSEVPLPSSWTSGLMDLSVIDASSTFALLTRLSGGSGGGGPGLREPAHGRRKHPAFPPTPTNTSKH
jgi:hypothetical protein